MLQAVSLARALQGALQSNNGEQIRGVLNEIIGQKISTLAGTGETDEDILIELFTNYGGAINALASIAALNDIVHNTAVIAAKAKDNSASTVARRIAVKH